MVKRGRHDPDGLARVPTPLGSRCPIRANLRFPMGERARVRVRPFRWRTGSAPTPTWSAVDDLRSASLEPPADLLFCCRRLSSSYDRGRHHTRKASINPVLAVSFVRNSLSAIRFQIAQDRLEPKVLCTELFSRQALEALICVPAASSSGEIGLSTVPVCAFRSSCPTFEFSAMGWAGARLTRL